MSWIKELFTSDIIDFFKTITNRFFNKETSKGMMLIGIVVGADYGLDIDTIERIFDGAEQDPISLILTLIFLIAYSKLIKKEGE